MIVDVYVKNFQKDIETFAKPHCIKVPSMPCKVSFDIGGTVDDADDNIVRDRLMDTLKEKKIVDNFAVSAFKLTKSADDDIAGLIATNNAAKVDSALKAYQKDLGVETKKFEAEVDDAFKTGWNKLIDDRQKYRAYKIKAAIDFTVNVVSLAGGIAGLATALTPAAPVTAVMGAYGILKNTTKLCVQVRNLYVEAETIAKDVDKDVEKLRAKLVKVQKEVETDIKDETEKAKKSKAVIKAKELSVAVGNKMFGDIVSVFVTSIEGAGKKNGQYGNKIRGVQELTVGFAKDYLKMTDHLNDMYKYVRALDDEYKKLAEATGYSAAAKPELARRQKTIRVAFDAWNESTKSMKAMQADVVASETRYQDNLKKCKDFQTHIDAAEKAFKTKNWAEAGRWLGVAADIGLSVGPSGAGAWANTDKIVTSTMKLVTIFEKEAITELKKKF